MPTCTIRKRIEAPCPEVFRLCTDFAHAAEHIPAIRKVEMLTDGPVGVGTRFRETRVVFKREAAETFEVSAFEPDRRVALQAESCGCRYEMEHTFTPDGQATAVEFHMKAVPLTFLARLMSPLAALMMGTMRKAIEADFDAIKAAAEKKARAGADVAV